MWRLSMFWRLFASLGFLVLAAIGCLGAVVLTRVDNHHEAQLQERIRTRLLLVREIVSAHDGQPLSSLDSRFRQLRKEGLPRITLIDDAGKVLLDTDGDVAEMENHGNRPEIVIAQKFGLGTATRESATLQHDFVYAAIRIPHATNGVLFVRIAEETNVIDGELANLRRIVWATAGVTIVVAMALAFWLARHIALPIQELTEGAESIAAGDYGQKVYASGADEVRTLARTFNHMSERLGTQFAELDEERQQLRAILSGMVEGVVALDAEQRILFVNERALMLLELTGQAVIGRRLWEVVRQRGPTDLVSRAMEEAEPCREELAWSGLVSRSLTVHAARLQGTVARGAVLVLHDTTELRRLERLRQEFVANVSHELKTPLSVIQACAETLLDGAADDPEHRPEFLQRICEQGHRLHSLILDLLSLARIESGAEVLAFQPIDLEDAVKACLERHSARAASKQQTLEGDFGHRTPDSGPLVQAWADEEALGEILDNLVDNAVKYTPVGGHIWVRCFTKEGQACLEVQDTGIGIPERDLPRVFERFYRVDKARSRELGGTGLGLSIVKHLAQAMHGSVQATSVVDKGSTFHVQLPQAP